MSVIALNVTDDAIDMNADKKYKYEAYKLELYTLCDVLYTEHLKTAEMA